MHHRNLTDEIMDGDSLSSFDLECALRGLQRIHNICRSAEIIAPRILAALPQKREISLLDIACGSGTLSSQIALYLQRAGKRIHLIGLDRNKYSLALLQEQAHLLPFKTETICTDITEQGSISCKADVVLCSYFCHHLKMEDTLALLQKMYDASRYLSIILDLRRSIRGFLLAYLGTRLLSRSPIVHHDGPVSVRGAYTTEEFRTLIHQSSWEDYTLDNILFQRFIFVGQRQHA